MGFGVWIASNDGNRGVGAGKLDYGAEQEVNGDTLFEIGSITKTFTALLLLDMVKRGEMKLDDPVAKDRYTKWRRESSTPRAVADQSCAPLG